MTITVKMMSMSICLFFGSSLLLYIILQFSLGQAAKKFQTLSTQWTQDLVSLFVLAKPNTILWAYLVASICVPIIIVLTTNLLGFSLILVIIFTLAPRLYFSFAKRKRRTQFETQLPDALLQIAGSIKAGSSLLKSIELLTENTKGPISQEFNLLVQEYRMGLTLEQAFHNLQKRLNSDSLDLVITICAIAQDTGGNLSENLQRFSSSLRQKNMIEKKIDALTSQGKLQGVVVGLLPIGIGLVLFQIEKEAMTFLFTSWLGYMTIIVVVTLETLGMLAINKIVAIDV